MSQEKGEKGRLLRTLGFWEALAIGSGTMMGAGIFLFPGLAGGEAGMAATLSFALGGSVALLVAFPSAELATAIPRSGGGYQYVSRGLGPLAGTLVGMAQWAGLVFASAFYLTGFGRYFRELLAEFGYTAPNSAQTVGFLGAILLTAIAILDTKAAGKLQNGSVGLLTLGLGALILYGLFKLVQDPAFTGIPEEGFAPRGMGSVLPTAALIFTSYIGFIQITTVAGDIIEPEKTLPRALLGSIALVSVLYLLTVYLTTALIDADRLADLGETALTRVGHSVMGSAGALVVLSAGLLATLSSANASILGSSRSVLALGQDGVLPRSLSRINRRFGTPHYALLMTGLPISALILFGRLEVLAEVASILHLLMYSLMCMSLLAFRRRPETEYRPSFRMPGVPILPLVGALACLGLVAWMEKGALILSGGVLAIAVLWHVFFARDVSFEE